jgi:hypothetical protein
MCHGGDGLSGGHGLREVPAGVRHGGRSGLSAFSCPLTLSFVSGDKGWLVEPPLSNRLTSAKCISVRTPHANLPDTLIDLTRASKSFQMLPGLPGVK